MLTNDAGAPPIMADFHRTLPYDSGPAGKLQVQRQGLSPGSDLEPVKVRERWWSWHLVSQNMTVLVINTGEWLLMMVRMH